MANVTQEQIQAQIAATLGAVEDSGAVLTDTKFSQNDTNLYDLLTGQQETRAKGWVITWKEISGFEVAGDCIVNLTLRYRLTLFYPYLNAAAGDVTSQALFLRLIDNSVDALNADRIFAALENNAEIISLTTRREFTVIDWTNSPKPEASHFGEFDLDVKVQRTY